MKVGLISDAPVCTTGFGRTSTHIAEALTEAGHKVVCFGFKALGQNFDPAIYPYRIWTVGAVWQSVMPLYLSYERFDVIFINMDLFNLKEVLSECLACGWQGPVLTYIVFDSLPAYPAYLEMLRHINVFSTSTPIGVKYLESLGFDDVLIGPSGVDMHIFCPLAQRNDLRTRACLSDYFVIGIFGRNCERKQQAKVLQALHYINVHHPDVAGKILLYFHCTPEGYWNLPHLSEQLDIMSQVLFATTLSNEAMGIPYVGEENLAKTIPWQTNPHMPDTYSYVQRMNCCDLIVNVPHSGDFEQVIIEAQACGVPLVHTDDGGIMSNAVGVGGMLLSPVDVVYGPIGQRLFFVSVEGLAEAILEIIAQPKLSSQLIKLGFENAKKYPWSLLRQMAVNVVDRVKNLNSDL